MPTEAPKCRHCRKRAAVVGRRGLCMACHKVPEIRRQYATGNPWRQDREPTEEELDAMIREQRPTMPGRMPGEH